MTSIRIVSLAGALWLCSLPAAAHSGPPYPIVRNQVAGPYRISVWTDPDATDDGTPAGRFWVTIDLSKATGAVASDLRARVSIQPLDRTGAVESAWTEPVDGDRSRQLVALLMDHEGDFGVHVEIESAPGRAALDSQVQATYDLRPPRVLLALYLMPFLLTGFLWAKLLVRRRSAQRRLVS